MRTVSRSALAFAWDAVTSYGEPVAGADRDHVRIPLSQQELARRHRCAPSTVAWYLRCLGPVVVTRRQGLVLDRHALTMLMGDQCELTSRTAAVERELLEAFAQPAADGTPAQFLRSPATLRPASLQDIATHLGINRSSAHRHLTALEQAGRLTLTGRRRHLAAPADDASSKEPLMQEGLPAADRTSGSVTPDQLLQLLDKVTEVMGLVASIAGQMVEADRLPETGRADPRTSGAQNPRASGAQTAAGVGSRTADAADHPRGSLLAFDLIDSNDDQIKSDPSDLRAEESRKPPCLRAEESRGTSSPDWTPADLPRLLAPLLEECDRRSLPGVADAQRVIASLLPYSSEQVTAAARQMATDLRSGAPMRSPIAILVRKAEDGDPYYFRSVRPAGPTAPLPEIVDHDEPVDEEAVAAVASLDAGALQAVDEAVRVHVERLLGPELATKAFAAPETLAHWRPIVWRTTRVSEPQAEEHP